MFLSNFIAGFNDKKYIFFVVLLFCSEFVLGEGDVEKGILNTAIFFDESISKLNDHKKQEVIDYFDNVMKEGLLKHEVFKKPIKGYYCSDAGYHTLLFIIAIGMGLNLTVIHTGKTTGVISKVFGVASGLPVSMAGLKSASGEITSTIKKSCKKKRRKKKSNKKTSPRPQEQFVEPFSDDGCFSAEGNVKVEANAISLPLFDKEQNVESQDVASAKVSIEEKESEINEQVEIETVDKINNEGDTQVYLSTIDVNSEEIIIGGKTISVKDFQEVNLRINQHEDENEGGGFSSNNCKAVCFSAMKKIMKGVLVFTLASIDASFDSMLAGQAGEAYLRSRGYGDTASALGFCFGTLWCYLPSSAIGFLGAWSFITEFSNKFFKKEDKLNLDDIFNELPAGWELSQNIDDQGYTKKLAEALSLKVMRECARRGVDMHEELEIRKKVIQRIEGKWGCENRCTHGCDGKCLGAIFQKKNTCCLLKGRCCLSALGKAAECVAGVGLAVSVTHLFLAEVAVKSIRAAELGGFAMGDSVFSSSNDSDYFIGDYGRYNFNSTPVFSPTTPIMDMNYTPIVNQYLSEQDLAIWSLIAYSVQSFNIYMLARSEFKGVIRDIAYWQNQRSKAYINYRWPTYFRRQFAKGFIKAGIICAYGWNLFGTLGSMGDLEHECDERWWCDYLVPWLSYGYGLAFLGLSFGKGADFFDWGIDKILLKYDQCRHSKEKSTAEAKTRSICCPFCPGG